MIYIEHVWHNQFIPILRVEVVEAHGFWEVSWKWREAAGEAIGVFVIMAMDNPPFIDDFSIFFPFTWPVWLGISPMDFPCLRGLLFDGYVSYDS